MLIMYILPTCPYCRKVLDFLDENSIEYSIRDINDPTDLSDLKMIGGKEQVPFMYDPNNLIGMYESENIMKYLKSRHCK